MGFYSFKTYWETTEAENVGNVSSIKYKIIWPVLIVICLVSAAMGLINYRETADSVQRKGYATLEVAIIGIENALYARKTAEEVMEKEMIGQAVLVSYLVERGLNYEQASGLAKRAGLDEIWVTDSAGQAILTNSGPDVKFDYAADPKQQAYEFMDLIAKKRETVVQPAQPRTIDPKVYKYVGVGGWSVPRIVQVGRDGAKLTELESRIGAKPLIQQLKERVGDEVLFAGIVDAEGSLLFASDESVQQLDTDIGELAKASLGSKERKTAASSYGSDKAMYYVSPLSNGQGLVLAMSTEVLNRILWKTVLCVVLANLISGAVVFLVVGRQFRRLDGLKQAMNELSQGEGDLTRQLPVGSKDEIGELSAAMNRFIGKIRAIVTEVKGTTGNSTLEADGISRLSNQTMEISREMNSTMEQVATAASRQAEEVERGMNGVHELAGIIDNYRKQTSVLEESNRELRHNEERGGAAVGDLIESIGESAGIVRDAGLSLDKLRKELESVGEMAEAITAISQQTGLLALNASIEAARAGEHGKGFAVVASEVRKLADQANDSAERIREMLRKVHESTSETVRAMDGVVRHTDSQERFAGATRDTFGAMKLALAQIDGLIGELSSGMARMEEKKNGIVEMIEAVSAASQQTAASSEEILAGVDSQLRQIEEMSGKARLLNRHMSQLQGEVNLFKV
jgi:methyl-accepting chemotaxis protein